LWTNGNTHGWPGSTDSQVAPPLPLPEPDTDPVCDVPDPVGDVLPLPDPDAGEREREREKVRGRERKRNKREVGSPRGPQTPLKSSRANGHGGGLRAYHEIISM
jgi:hypothetical protein